MNAFLKRAGAVAVIAFAVVSPVQASGVSDLWWNPNESGWGVNVVGQSDIFFLTFFVYGQDGQPLWLVAPATKYTGPISGGGSAYSGPLYKTSGPWLGGSFNPGAVSATEVGAVTFSWLTPTTATLAYTYNGTGVTKSITRQTWTSNHFLAGKYLGGIVLDRTGCSGASRYESLAQFTVSISGSTMQIAFQPSSGASCSVSGALVQEGSMSRFSGSGTSCTNGASGTVNYFAIDAGPLGMAGRIESTSGNCREVGTFGGVWRAD